MTSEHFERLHQDMVSHLEGKSVFVRDAAVGAEKTTRINTRVVTEKAWANFFISNMFIRLEDSDVLVPNPERPASPIVGSKFSWRRPSRASAFGCRSFGRPFSGPSGSRVPARRVRAVSLGEAWLRTETAALVAVQVMDLAQLP